jgi:hypothetical protein
MAPPPGDTRAVELLCRPERAPVLPFGQAIQILHAFGPRCRFVKTVHRRGAIHAARAGDTVNLTLAYWSMTHWCQYLVARRTGRDHSSSRSGASR